MTEPTPVPTLPDPLVPLVVTPDALDGQTVEPLARLHAQLAAVVTVAEDARQVVRDRLDEAAYADADGQGMTRRLDGIGQVIVTAPKPSARIVDRDAFAVWVDRLDPAAPFRCEEVDRVEVDPAGHATVAAAVLEVRAWLTDPETDAVELPAELLDRLVGPLTIRTEWLVPSDALEQLVAVGRVAIAGEVVDLDTGEAVPGTTVTPAGPARVQVRPDKAAASVAEAHVRRALRQLAAGRREELTRG